MSIVVELPVHPFAVPETVTVDLPPGPSGEARSEPVPLSALTADALSQLCDEFRRAAFEKAQMETQMPDLRGKDYSVEVRRSNGHFVASSPEWEAADRPHRGFGETAGAATRDLWAKLDEALCWLAPEVMPKPKGAKHVQP